MADRDLQLSPLAYTWIFDLNGTLVVHNDYKTGCDEWLPEALEFLKAIFSRHVKMLYWNRPRPFCISPT